MIRDFIFTPTIEAGAHVSVWRTVSVRFTEVIDNQMNNWRIGSFRMQPLFRGPSETRSANNHFKSNLNEKIINGSIENDCSLRFFPKRNIKWKEQKWIWITKNGIYFGFFFFFLVDFDEFGLMTYPGLKEFQNSLFFYIFFFGIWLYVCLWLIWFFLYMNLDHTIV